MISQAIDPTANVRAFAEAAAMIVRERRLLLALAKREISDRFVGQVFGLLWVVAYPSFMMALWLFVFAFVFKTRIGGTHELPLDYTAYLLSGLVPWLSFQDAMSRSCMVVMSSAGMIRQGLIRAELLPVKVIVTALLTQGIMLAVLCGYVFATNGALFATYLLLPVLIVFQALAMIGVGYILAAVTVFFRDAKDIVSLFIMAGPFMMPVFYLPDWVPAAVRPVLYANPFSYLVWCYQDALYFGRIEHPVAWAVFGLGSTVLFALGYRVFRKLQPIFGNIL